MYRGMFHFDFETQKRRFETFIIKNLKKLKYPVFPLFSLTTIAILWGFFLTAAHFGHDVLRANSPQLPANDNYIFKGISYFPDCSNIRSQVGRLFSYQIVHNGLSHIIGNTTTILIYGSLLENLLSFYSAKMRFIFCLLVFEGGVLYGALSFSSIYPFDAIVGASAGVYSLIGSNLSMTIMYSNKMYLFKWIFAVWIVGLLLITDFIFYFVRFNYKVAYVGHAGGFLFGLFSGLSLGLWEYKRDREEINLLIGPTTTQSIQWKPIAGGISLASLLVFTVLLLNDYVGVWPPREPQWNPTFHKGYPPAQCCRQMFSMMAKNHSLTKGDIAKEYYCSWDSELVKYNGTV